MIKTIIFLLAPLGRDFVLSDSLSWVGLAQLRTVNNTTDLFFDGARKGVGGNTCRWSLMERGRCE